MLIKTLLTLSLALMFTGCRIKNSETTTTTDGRIVTVIRIQPGQKLIEVGSHPVSGHQYASVWVQTRPALEGEEFGSILHTEYKAEDGSIIRKILLVEQALPDSASKQSPMGETETPAETETPVESTTPDATTKKTECAQKKVASFHCEDLPWQ